MYACLYAPGNLAVLIECAQYFSPHIEQTSADTIVFRTDGLDHLFGPPGQLAAAIANRIGIPGNIAIATEPDTAIHAARGIPGVTVIPPGSEAKMLAPLPLSLLETTPETAQILDAWGIHTFGELAALPPLGIAARLGEEGTHLHEQVRGESSRQLRPIEEPLQFEESLELDYPVDLLEPLAFLLARLINDLCQRLAFRALAANEIRLCLFLEDRTQHEATLKLPLPMRDPQAFLKLLQLELDARPPQSPVVKIRIALEPVKPRIQQQGLFLPASPEPERLEITLARLMNLLGAENVGSPRIRNTHRPDSFQMDRFSTLIKAPERPAIPPHLILRRYRPLKHAQVILTNQRPSKISSLRVNGKVVACAGPWRTSGEWWMPEPWDRDEWDVALSDGEGSLVQSSFVQSSFVKIYRIHEDRRTGRWFLEGNYD
jgi:protein ImuB